MTASSPSSPLPPPLRALSGLLPSLDGDRNAVRELWDRLEGVPGGARIFSAIVGRMAPYTGTIGGRVEALRSGYAEVRMVDRPGLRNHLKSVHAIALANLGELTGNVALAYALPDDARFIVAGLTMDYLKKARGDIRGVCECPVPSSSARKEYEVLVRMLDGSSEVVATCTLRTLVGPKRKG